MHQSQGNRKPGSILFVRSKSKISKAIAWATRGKVEKPTLATHVDMFIEDTVICGIAKWRPYARSWHAYKQELERDGAEWCVFTPRNLTDEDEKKLQCKARDLITTRRYGYGEIPLQLIDGLVAKYILRRKCRDFYWFRKGSRLLKKTVLCSTFVAEAFADVSGWPEKLQHGSPDDLFDHLMESLGEWDITEHSADWFKPWIEVRTA